LQLASFVPHKFPVTVNLLRKKAKQAGRTHLFTVKNSAASEALVAARRWWIDSYCLPTQQDVLDEVLSDKFDCWGLHGNANAAAPTLLQSDELSSPLRKLCVGLL